MIGIRQPLVPTSNRKQNGQPQTYVGDVANGEETAEASLASRISSLDAAFVRSFTWPTLAQGSSLPRI
jgi:hypothetical protein